jgi:hypothetical protein
MVAVLRCNMTVRLGRGESTCQREQMKGNPVEVEVGEAAEVLEVEDVAKGVGAWVASEQAHRSSAEPSVASHTRHLLAAFGWAFGFCRHRILTTFAVLQR